MAKKPVMKNKTSVKKKKKGSCSQGQSKRDSTGPRKLKP
jgi:hypothetical protein